MKSKTKLFLISTLSLCMLATGVTAITVSANNNNDEPVVSAPMFTLKGTSIRLPKVENGVSDGITGVRFAVQMSIGDWNTYSADLAETWITLSYDDTVSAPVYTTNNWYTVDDAGRYLEENFKAYQSTVVLYDIDADYFATNFKVQAFARFKGEETVIMSEQFVAKSMSQVAVEYAGTDVNKLQAVETYLPNYTITFDVDGVQATETAKHGTPVSALQEYLANVNTEKVGYEFTGWTIGDYTLEQAIAANATLTGDVTVKANWEADTYTVSFDGLEETQTVKYGEKVTAPAATPTKAGFIFVGWDFDFATAITGDVEIKAKWQEVVEVGTYDAFRAAVTTKSNAYIKLTSHIDPIKEKGVTEQRWTQVAGDFTGTIDGDGYSIKNLTYYDGSDNWVDGFAMFELFSGTVKNIGFENFELAKDNGIVLQSGVIARYFTGTAEDVFVSVRYTRMYAQGDMQQSGAMFGVLYTGATIKNCVVKLTVSDDYTQKGGIGYVAGFADCKNVTIENFVAISNTSKAGILGSYWSDAVGGQPSINGIKTVYEDHSAAAAAIEKCLIGTEAKVIAGADEILGDAWTCNGVQLPALAHTPLIDVVKVATYDEFRTAVTTQPDAYIALTDDIDPIEEKGVTKQLWEIVMTEFTGTIDGRGYSIKNLTYYNDGSNWFDGVSMFFRFSGTIKNIAYENIILNKEKGVVESSGAIARLFSGTAENVYVSACFIRMYAAGDPQQSGAMFGALKPGASVKNCVVKLSVNNDYTDKGGIGYIAGRSDTNAVIENFVAVKTVTSKAQLLGTYWSDELGGYPTINGVALGSSTDNAGAINAVAKCLIGTEAEVIAGAGAILGDAWVCDGVNMPTLRK